MITISCIFSKRDIQRGQEARVGGSIEMKKNIYEENL